MDLYSALSSRTSNALDAAVLSRHVCFENVVVRTNRLKQSV